MLFQAVESLPELYERDETAWLEAMAGLARDGRAADLDLVHLAEYLADMARRDRREVSSRLAVLMAHLLKWEFQPDHRSRSWRATIVAQRQELAGLVEGGTLRNHAEAALAGAYANAVERAAAETGLPEGTFPEECPYTVDQLLAADVPSVE
jgi:hypothetical protein